MADSAGAPFTILTVCTGNICRSPLAEQLLAARLGAAGVPVTVTSAGTGALVGRAMPPEAAELSLRYGGEPAEHRARQLTAGMVEQADLVLTASREQRGEVVSLFPRASRYTFTLAQFARIASAVAEGVDSVPAADEAPNQSVTDALREYVATIAASRGYAPPPARALDDDIEDPYRQSRQVYERSGKAIDEAVTVAVAGLTSAIGRS